MSERIWLVKSCELFERLTPGECERLEGRARLRTFRRGEIIYSPADPGLHVLVLVEGRVKLKGVTPDGKESILAFVDEGEMFGELAWLNGEPRQEFAEAVQASRILAIPSEELQALLQRRPDLFVGVTKLIGLRRRRIETRLQNLLFRSNRERVALILLELSESHSRPRGDAWEITLPLSHQDLAGLVGATRESVTIALGRLQKEGLIEMDRRRIVILDGDRLAAEAKAAGFALKGHSSRQDPVRARIRQPGAL